MSAPTLVYAPSARSAMDLAVGILIGLRGCDENAAFRELLQTANTHNVSPFQIARALITIATHATTDLDPDSPAYRIAAQHWSILVG